MLASLRRPVLTVLLAVGVTAALAAAASGSTRAAHGPPGRAASSLAGTWGRLPAAPVTKLPDMMATVWTGHEMFIHGIRFSVLPRRVTFAYRPATNTWAVLARGPRPATVESHDVPVWTGSEVLVIGPTSAAYNPATNAWRPIARLGAPTSDIVGWTGHRVLMWQGTCCGGLSPEADAYDPVTDTWAKLPPPPLQPRRGAEGAWTGKELVVAGGSAGLAGSARLLRSAAAYNPATNTWRRLPQMPRAEQFAKAVWDGREILFLSGSPRGLAFNPKTNRWRRLPAMPFPRLGFAAVWTGRHLLVWGGLTSAGVPPPHGEAYNPATNRWTALPLAPLHGRKFPAAVWTGRKMIVWGGFIPTATTSQTFLDGAAFKPRAP